jgi:hypothetical protein
MPNDLYRALQKKAIQIESSQDPPVFYKKHKKEILESLQQLQDNIIHRECIKLINIEQDSMGHGYEHSKAVAVDAGAIVKIESRVMDITDELIPYLVTSAHISGLLHDIKRGRDNHAIIGSIEAGKFLDCFRIEERFKRYIITAIRNHEAFKDTVPAEDEFGELISNALYDADKFRWGPENFTRTIWSMLEYGKVSPRSFLENFKKGMDYIERIKDTFRTETGKRYGPEIIDRGLEIGETIYRELSESFGKSRTIS